MFSKKICLSGMNYGAKTSKHDAFVKNISEAFV